MIPCFYLYYLVHCGSGCAAVARPRVYVLRMLPVTRHENPISLFFFCNSKRPSPPRPVFQSNVSFNDLPLLRTHHTCELLGYDSIRSSPVGDSSTKEASFSNVASCHFSGTANARCYVDSSSRALLADWPLALPLLNR